MSENWGSQQYDIDATGVILLTALTAALISIAASGPDVYIIAIVTWTTLITGFSIYKYKYRAIDWAKDVSIGTYNNGLETFKNLFPEKSSFPLKPYGLVRDISPRKFAVENVQNHRAQLSHRRIDDVYPAWDRPRGLDDVRTMMSLVYASYRVSPVMILSHNRKFTVLDGAHRIAAAYITGSDIRYQLYAVDEPVEESTGGTDNKVL